MSSSKPTVLCVYWITSFGSSMSGRVCAALITLPRNEFTNVSMITSFASTVIWSQTNLATQLARKEFARDIHTSYQSLLRYNSFTVLSDASPVSRRHSG